VCDPTSCPSAVEQRLAGILAKLLCTDQFGRNENFLLLGGDSLLAVQLITKVRATFGVELPLHSLFETPTVAELSGEIDRLLLGKTQATNDDDREHILGSGAGSEAGDL
jgi:acyl carrier protein